MRSPALQAPTVRRSDPLRDQVYRALQRMLSEGTLGALARLADHAP